MNKKVAWLMVSRLMVIVLLLMSCAPVPTEDEKAAPPAAEEEVVTEEEEEEVAPAPTATPVVTSCCPGWCPGPRGLAITPDGKTAYISFSYSDSLLVVDLSTFTTIKSIDLSSAGSMLSSSSAILSRDGKKLYVANPEARNVMIINTDSNSVEETLPIATKWEGDSIGASHNGTAVYIVSSDGKLYIVNSSDNSYQKISIPGIVFESVEPSVSHPNLLYCLGRLSKQGGSPQQTFFTFNLSRNAIAREVSLTNEELPPDTVPTRFTINSDETIAYFGPYKHNDKGVGNFNVFDLNSFEILTSTPIECGITDFAVNEETGKIYIIGFWSGGGAPGTLDMKEWDMSTNSVVREIPVSPASDQRAIAIDPTDSNYLYIIDCDHNYLMKVEISSGKEIIRLKFNKEDISPHALIRGDNVGYIVCHRSRDIYKLDLTSGQLMGTFSLPSGASSAGGYYQDKLYFSGGRYIYSIDPSDGSLIDTFDIGRDINPVTFTFFNDKMATISFEQGGMVGKELLIFDAKDMTLLKSIDLPSEPHGKSVIPSPDGSKLYISRGHMFGKTVITIFDGSSLDVINTIEIPFEQHCTGATSFLEGDFDEANRILYLSGFISIYKIDMDTDELIGNLSLLDALESRRAAGAGGWYPSGLAGVILSSTRDKLFVVSGDAHSVFIYDLLNSTWMTQTTDLEGYFPTDSDCSADRKYLYTVNQKSDSITMVDLTTGDVVRVIRL